VYILFNYRRRLLAVFIFFFLFLIVGISRLFFIQLFRSDYLSEIAKKQHNLFVELEPRRGTIYDSRSRPQAVNLVMDSLFVTPRSIPDKEKEKVIRVLSQVLNLDSTALRSKLYRKKSFVWIARKIPALQADAIKKANLKGVGFIKESKRSYPNGYLASHVIGFSGLDNNGLEGLELLFDKYLKGEPGWSLVMRDARQKKLDFADNMLSPVDGCDLFLSIDEIIQYIAERELDKAYNEFHAKGASIIVMDPYSGAILAMANRPTFDMNDYSKVTKDQMRNRAICDLFEPGSVFKVVTASAALEEKKVKEEDRFFCENGSYRYGNRVLHDHKPHGVLTFREVIELSSNIGTSKVAQLLGPDLLYRYIRLFGFGAKTGIDLPGEIPGMIRGPKSWSKTSILSIPMGQEVGVTALQLASAMSVIANGGQLMKPFVVREVRDKNGKIVQQFPPRLVNQVLSADTAARIRKILTGVVEEGTGKLAKIPGFSAAGKTGTAQKLEPNGTYSHDKFIASFVGFAPAEEPLITIVVSVDEPRPVYFGGVVAAPVFSNVAVDVLRYLRTNQAPEELPVFSESVAGNN